MLNVIVKADVQGSLTSVIDSLKSLDNSEVAVRLVATGGGGINENDLHMASSTGAVVYGFHVGLPTSVKRLASRDKVAIKLYSIIYELLDDAKEELQKLLIPKIVETELGRLLVKGVFKISKTEVICGGEVTKGKLAMPALANVYRDDKLIAQDLQIVSLKRGPQEVKEVQEGEMCGLSFASKTRVEVQEGDRIELFRRETQARTL